MQILHLNGDEDVFCPSTGEIIYEGGWIMQSKESVLGYLEFEDEGISDIFAKENCSAELKKFIDSMEYADLDEIVLMGEINKMEMDNVLCITVERQGETDEEDTDDYTPDYMGFIFVSIN